MNCSVFFKPLPVIYADCACSYNSLCGRVIADNSMPASYQWQCASTERRATMLECASFQVFMRQPPCNGRIPNDEQV
jgi:hypothetical protein